MTPERTDPRCDGQAALGPCTHAAKYVVQPAVTKIARAARPSYACGLHLAQLVKNRIPAWGYVAVGEVQK